MDIDFLEEIELAGSSKVAGKRPSFVPVDDAHPFELENYISTYSGRTAVDRLIYIISLCPSIAPHAFHLAVDVIQKMRDPSLLQSLINVYEHMSALRPDDDLPPHSEIAIIDQGWIEQTNSKNQAEKTKLEVELKTYTSNMIKESIRMAYRDLGDFSKATGDFSTALKHYSKSREFCTTSQHVLDMCMSVLELLLEQRNYAHVTTYVFKADAALEAVTGAARGNAANANAPTAPAGSLPPKERIAAEREKVQTKLDVATALSHLGQGQFEKAAQSFLKVGPVKGLEDWASKIISPADIAIYTTLCALATFPRPAIKAQLLENDNFGVYIEQEPYIRELIQAYLGSRFKTVLELLDRYSTRHFIDIHLSNHVTAVTEEIRDRAIVLYFQPFASIKLERMSAAFGWDVDYLEQQVVSLIQKGDIQARVDRQNKILKARVVDQRSALFERAIKSGLDMESANRKLLLRMRLQQADLTVKAPKGQQNLRPAEYMATEYP